MLIFIALAMLGYLIIRIMAAAQKKESATPLPPAPEKNVFFSLEELLPPKEEDELPAQPAVRPCISDLPKKRPSQASKIKRLARHRKSWIILSELLPPRY